MSTSGIGTYIRDARVAANISLRQVARAVGLSPTFLGEIERGIRPTLSRKHWQALICAVPSLTYEGLERATTRPMQLDIKEAPPQYQDLTYALARRIEKRDLSADDFAKLFEMLKKDDK